MRPQDDEPCVNCRKWSNRNGCEHYNNAALVLFGACFKKDIIKRRVKKTRYESK